LYPSNEFVLTTSTASIGWIKLTEFSGVQARVVPGTDFSKLYFARKL
jgi:hypothetical protein